MTKRSKKKKRKEPVMLQQLCLFDDQVMNDLVETRQPVKAAGDPGNKQWLSWQLDLLPLLKGQSYRDQKAFFTGKVKPVSNYLVRNKGVS